ncbi:McKusick-Kaufman/Bardet-Biedl syndromes putative chaperonin [Biomphalaria glabrata]|uniref:Molecular chaperone MKKS-like n=1 Tax=Biomphalaria glabrata TaxID=6526 RepID=A0A9W2ZW49_BIOGL|nr:molecular chaperone MKKS-like [Biomphalaria glabrata]XP_055879202.1 molecular chaperone MKKS-like [Biomphalaria glabrata]XP_055879203.1 molecular chaperone MKKS-like [Biomphalaria glabrata]KAI8740445.1 McKusick-Kaufman/Bardet-Biedl syndromes putative chaperonin-like [Biomphalaria glabrata]
MERMETSQVSTYKTSQQTVLKFYNLLKACAGPLGAFHMLRNGCGGHVTLTSTSSRLIPVMSLSRPELKLVASSVQSHLNQYGDCGLFMACSSLYLIKASLQLDIDVATLSSLYEVFVQTLDTYMTLPDSDLWIKADFTKLDVLIAYVRSVVRSKSFATLNDHECENISQLIVTAFVESIPLSHVVAQGPISNGVFVLGLEKRHIKESCLHHGLIIEYSELSSLKGIVQLSVKTAKDFGVAGDKTLMNVCIKVALVTCSLSGDLEEIIDAVYEVTQKNCDDLQNMIMGRMMAFSEELERLNVGLVLCQKVIHPELKTLFSSKGILYVERTGLQIIPYLQDLTGAEPIASFIQISGIRDKIGKVTTVEHLILAEKSFLLLTRTQSSVVTLVICEQWEERLSELKASVRTVLTGLHSLVKVQKLLPGGGCWQSHCAYQLKSKITTKMKEISKEVSCSNGQVLSALSVFLASLHNWVYAIHKDPVQLLVDPVSYHCWKLPETSLSPLSSDYTHCCCGMKSAPKSCMENFPIIPRHESASFQSVALDQPAEIINNSLHPKLVLDNYLASKEALLRSVFTAGLVLSIDTYIFEKY